MNRRKRYLESQIGTFIRKYSRKKIPGLANDRQYDRKFEEQVKRMNPWELNELLYGEPLTEDELLDFNDKTQENERND